MAYLSVEEASYRYGAVVRSFFPHRKALLIMEPGVGVYYAQFNRMPKYLFSVGMIIGFILKTTVSGFCYIKDATFEVAPAMWVVEDLLFLHHFCELCQRFIFGPSDATGAFFLFQLLSQPLAKGEDAELKKLSILRDFFLMLGHYVPGYLADDISSCFKNMKNDSLVMVKRRMKQWLRACICSCEPTYALKTIHFLTTEQGAMRL